MNLPPRMQVTTAQMWTLDPLWNLSVHVLYFLNVRFILSDVTPFVYINNRS